MFKSRSQGRLWWSFTAAVGLHAVLFLWSPTWVRQSPPDLGAVQGAGIEVVALQGGAGSSSGIIPGSIVAAEPEEAPVADEAEGEPDEPDEPGRSEWSLAGAYEARGSDALREELERRAQPAPTLAESEVDDAGSEEASDGDGAAQEGGGRPQVGGTYTLSEHEALTEDELLALERLSALRPELAFASRSNWILVRNPSDLEEFLRERFTGPGEGIVSVAIWVDERGSVEWAEIQRSSGRPDLDESALELFREVIAFRPAREGGVNVPMAAVLSVPFPW